MIEKMEKIEEIKEQMPIIAKNADEITMRKSQEAREAFKIELKDRIKKEETQKQKANLRFSHKER